MSSARIATLIRSGYTRDSAQAIVASVNLLRDALKPFANLNPKIYLPYINLDDIAKAQEAMEATK
jgi:hypothetical protein